MQISDTIKVLDLRSNRVSGVVRSSDIKLKASKSSIWCNTLIGIEGKQEWGQC